MSRPHAEARPIRDVIDGLRVEDLRASQRIKWRLFGDEVLPAWVADMDFPVAPAVQRAVQELVDRSDFGYHLVPLSPPLRDALVARMQDRFSWSVDPASVLALVNVVQGLDAAVLLYSRPGEGVIVQTPIYPPFLAAVEKSGRRLVENPLLRGPERFEIDFDRLRASIDADTRLLLLCNPHNPTGRVFERGELVALGELALEHDLTVVSDEIHAELTFDGHEHLPFATLGPELARRTVTLTSATKAFNLAGLPCAFAIFGSDELAKPFRELPPHVLGHCGILDDAATRAAWTGGQPWLDEVMVYLTGNRERVMEFLARELPAVRVFRPEATYLAWLECRELGLPEEPFRFFLKRARVALSRGSEFGSPGESCVRLNFATSRTILDEILERMAEALGA
ncbi:MAG: PatB family C-S lyase [Myxococcota bacterium]|nr:PatB family C-S lyase [Myxococcota bacterium]